MPALFFFWREDISHPALCWSHLERTPVCRWRAMEKDLWTCFVYLNSNSDSPRSITHWKDAKQQDNFFMLIRYLEQPPFPAEAAYVGLAPRGAPRSWQLDAKGYQFWT
ncbi:unnamed protein product [Coffea canephora]|uniref:Uncharacterized protein n=1 Tax=Coffea canephora TaxID=49390 RepID=A0A068TZC0_COFCA|nr:unnamed protein product [Coffea canephora]